MDKKEDVMLLAQLLHAMKEAVDKLEKFQKRKDTEGIMRAKRELLELQKRVNTLI